MYIVLYPVSDTSIPRAPVSIGITRTSRRNSIPMDTGNRYCTPRVSPGHCMLPIVQ